MPKKIIGIYAESSVEIVTRENDSRISAGNLIIRVTSEPGESSQTSLSKDKALELAVID